MSVDYNELVAKVQATKSEVDRLAGELILAEARHDEAVKLLDYAIAHGEERPIPAPRIDRVLRPARVPMGESDVVDPADPVDPAGVAGNAEIRAIETETTDGIPGLFYEPRRKRTLCSNRKRPGHNKSTCNQ